MRAGGPAGGHACVRACLPARALAGSRAPGGGQVSQGACMIARWHARVRARSRARVLAQQIAETDRLTMGRLRDLIRVSEDTVLKDGLAAEVSLFGTHIAGVSQEQVGTNRTAVIKRGQSITANEE